MKNFPSLAPHITKESLKDIAASTLRILEEGKYELDGMKFDLKAFIKYTNDHTSFYSADSNLSSWGSHILSPSENIEPRATVRITVLECSTLYGARKLKEEPEQSEDVQEKRIGVLNFASAKKPGGGFLTGAQAQEESIARSSTIYPSFMTKDAQKFYQFHKRDPKKGYYSHAMIYSPRVLLLRSDTGE